MKLYSLKLASLLLVIAMLLVGAAFAEDAALDTPDIHTVTLPSGKSYTFPMSVAECEAAGIPLPELEPLNDGEYYLSVDVNNGREQFAVRVETDVATGEFCVTGFSLTVYDISGATLAGITVGETTQTEVYDLLGPDMYDRTPGEYSSMTYYYFMKHENLDIYFDSADANAAVKSIFVSTDLPSTYGSEVSAQAGVAQSDLPSVSEMAFNQFILDGKLYQSGDTLQKLLDNGWILPATRDVNATIAARENSRVSGDQFDLYNGSGIVKVYVYNTSESECALSECLINQVVVDEEGKAALTIADGLEIGSNYADVAGTFGEPSRQSANDDGSNVNTFKVLNNLYYEITELDGVVTNISIRGLMNN